MYELKDYKGKIFAYINTQNITSLVPKFEVGEWFTRASIWIDGTNYILAEDFDKQENDKVRAYLDKIVKELSVE